MLPLSTAASCGSLRSRVRAFCDDEGATAVEYAVLIAVTLVVVMGAISLLGIKNRDIWDDVGTAMQKALGGSL